MRQRRRFGIYVLLTVAALALFLIGAGVSRVIRDEV
jgi:hypothetical protein